MLWYSIPKRRGHSKTNQQVKKYFNNFILQHPQVVHYTIANDYLKLSIDGKVETKLVPKWVL